MITKKNIHICPSSLSRQEYDLDPRWSKCFHSDDAAFPTNIGSLFSWKPTCSTAWNSQQLRPSQLENSRAAQEVFLRVSNGTPQQCMEMPCRMVYNGLWYANNYSYSGESKPTNITGGPHIVELLAFAHVFSSMLPHHRAPKNRADATQGRRATRLPLFFPLHAFSPEPSSVLSCRADAKTGELNWLRSRSVFDWDWESDG